MEELSFKELISNINSDLTERTGPLTLKQKFALFMLPDTMLNKTLRGKKAAELNKFESEFKSTHFRNYQTDSDKSISEISAQLTTLATLDFCQNSEEKVMQLNILKEDLQKLYSEYSVNKYSIIEARLKKLSELRHPEYEDYSKICAIIDLKNSLSNTESIKLHAEILPDRYRKIYEIEHQKQTSLEIIKSELLTFKYFLSDTINDEIIFALAYVDPQALRQNAPTLHTIVRRRKYLYKDIYSALPADLRPDIKEFNFIYLKYFDPERDFLYYKLRQIIKLFQFCKDHSLIASSIIPPHSKKLNDHLDRLLLISLETKLTDISTYNRTYIDILTSQFGITQTAIADALGIKPENITQQKKKGTLKTTTSGQWALTQIFNCSVDFLRGETTIPHYGKIFPKSDKPEFEEEENTYFVYLQKIVSRAATAENLLSYFATQVQEDKYVQTMLYKQEKAPSVLKIISLLKQKIADNKYSVDDFEFLVQLLTKI